MIPDFPRLEQAEKFAKRNKLKVVVTEVLGGGKFYVQSSGYQEVASIQQQLASLNLQEAHLINGSFNPKKGDLVLAKFSGDHSWKIKDELTFLLLRDAFVHKHCNLKMIVMSGFW
ncbi:hypothetical protein POM88_007162 [Heracleum sosnowskyi]|uniref:Tudor domain-containing protein n=1 Tax=Heracleum sosnowskyi TaxID=360622 RepID=A0AAD8J450_9APIA|nr:hypothetical protein POM88_007162 [Heracleum sosnowskyi]